MTPGLRFARILHAVKPTPPNALRTRNRFAKATTGRYPTKPSEMRQMKRFLEGEDPTWVGKRNAADKKSPEDHLSAGIRKAMEAILDDESLELAGQAHEAEGVHHGTRVKLSGR